MGNVFEGKKLYYCQFASNLNGGQMLKKICLRNIFFPLRIGPFQKGLNCPRAIERCKSCSFVKRAEKIKTLSCTFTTLRADDECLKERVYAQVDNGS